MKNFLILFSLLLAFQGYSQDYNDEQSNLNWLTDLNEAKQVSAETKKPIIIYFTGSDWCGPCKMLKADFFSSDRFEKIAEGLVLLKVDIPRRKDIVTPEQLAKNKKVVRQYNKGGSYPNLVAIDSKGNVIGALNGYTFLRETDRHFAFVESVIENYY